MRNRTVQVVAACVAVVLLGVVGAGCGSGSGSNLSAETITYMDSAFPALEKAMKQWNNGNYETAVATWKAIGDVPTSTASDEVVANHYLKYANNVRYYFMQDGSATLKDVEESKADAESMYAAMKSQ